MKQKHPDMKKRILESNIFGSSLKQLTKKDDGLVVPYVLFRLCNFIGMNGMTEKGLFNSNTNPDHLEYLKTCFNKVGDVPLETESSTLSAADLLKLFLLELADPVIPSSMHAAFSTAVNGYSRKECAQNLKQILLSIPEENYIVLKYISQFLNKVTCHNIQNEMTASELGCIFGPLIFRMNDTGKDTYQDMMRNEVVTCFISDYQAIFVKEVADIFEAAKPQSVSSEIFVASMISENSKQKVSSMPPLMMSSLSLPPLSVVIPPIEKSLAIESLHAGSDLQIPTLLIDREKKVYEKLDQMQILKGRKNIIIKNKAEELLEGTCCTRTFEDIPSCKANGESFLLSNEHSTYSGQQKVNLLTLNNQADEQEKVNTDEETDSLKENILEKGVPIKSFKISTKGNTKPCRTQDHNQSHDRNAFSTQAKNSHTEKSFQVENNISSERDEVFPSLALSQLQENEINDEPVLSEQCFSWPLLKSAQDDEAMLSPSVNFLRNASSSEAPLSPSAYKAYLSQRSLHLDHSVPPSPPKEQDDFCNRVVKNSVADIKIKQLKKKIHGYKKKLKQFDETFEDEHGYRPSRAEKMSYPNMKKLIVNLNKARKDLKEGGNGITESGELTGKSHWLLTKDIHILEDTTNSTTIANDKFVEENEYKLTFDYKNKPSVEESFNEAMKNLQDERKHFHRPEDFEAMSKEEIMDEKLAIQKSLLQLEDIHGRPIDKFNRDIMRPLYDRYHNIKCFIRSGNLGSVSSVKDAGKELQPIIENVAMEFTSRQNSITEKDQTDVLPEQSEENEDKASSGIRLHKRYCNSNLHELPFSELLNEQQQTRSEKRKLRRILKEFEDEFHKKTGRKVQNEDKLPMEGVYAEYKHMKGRLRLLEALVYKQKQHKVT